MADMIETAPSAPEAPVEKIDNVVIIKIANGFLVSPGLYVGDATRVYVADIDAATAKVKEFYN